MSMSRRDEIERLRKNRAQAIEAKRRADAALESASEELWAALRAEREDVLRDAPRVGAWLAVVRLTKTQIITVEMDASYHSERRWKRIGARGGWGRGASIGGRGSIDVPALEASHPDIMAQETWSLPGWTDFVAIAFD